MGKKSPPPKAPDLTPISNAQIQIAKDSNDIAREQLGLSREQFQFFMTNAKEELALARTQADKLFGLQEKAFASDEEAKAFARQVGQSQIDAMNLQMGYAKEDRQRYKDVFLPMQDKFISEANAYDTPERREAEASRQMVDVQRQAEAQRNNADQRLRSMGIDPSQFRSASLINQMGVATAANQALAGNQARQQIEDRGRALRADAINMGMGLPAQASAGFGGAGQAGAGAINAGQASQQAQLGAIQGGAGVMGTGMGFRSQALNNVAALTGSPMQWAQMGGGMMGQAANTYGAAANTMSQGFNNQMSSWQAGQQQSQQRFNNIMSVAGMAAGMMMAEGGEVTAERAAAAGVGGGGWADIKAKHKAKRAAADPYNRKPQGISDRMGNAVAAAGQYQPTNVYADNPIAPTAMTSPIQFRAEGGGIRALPVRQTRDKYPTMLGEGEYVIPHDVVRSKGIEFFDKLVNKYHRENA